MKLPRFLKVGLFFITLGTAGTGYVVLSSDGFNRLNTKIYEVVMDDVTGLTTNSKVFLAGVPVGKIRSIDLSDNQALIRVAFLKDIEIRGNAQISRKSSSILGTSVLTLAPGNETEPLIMEGGRIGAVGGNGDMTSIAQDLGGELSAMIRELQTNQLQLLQVSLETFNAIAKKFDDRSEAELDRMTRILESTALLTERMERLLADKEEDLSVSVGEIRFALENIRSITGEISAGEGNIGQAIYDDSLYNSILATAQRTEEAASKLDSALSSINDLAVNADRVVTDAGTIVSKATGLGVQVDSGARYDVLSSTMRAGASLYLNPRSNDRWYRVGVASTPEGIRSRTVTETSVNGGSIQRVDSTETVHTVAIDAELAREFGSLTLRGGLLESTAALGVDFKPVRWVSLSGEVFNFRSGEAPNLRGTLTLFPFFDPDSEKPWNWVYLKGGVNSALNANRDYFFGAGVRFTDEEVRGLVGLIPLAGK